MSFAYRTTKFTLDLLTRMIGADVRLHNADVVKKDMSIIFVANHFTRLETFLVPYFILKNTGLQPWSLASGDLYRGKVGTFLRSVGGISTKDPDRDRIIINSLLSASHPWVIFPEGSMIKDKKLVDRKGSFQIYSRGGRRPPFTGAAVLALRAEFYRQKLQCIEAVPDQSAIRRSLAQFDLKSVEDVVGHHTTIIPVNVTYYPIRAQENVFLNLARKLTGEMSPRAMEELSVEGTILASDTDIDITLGEPIDVRSYLDGPEFAELLACDPAEEIRLEENPRSVFNEAANSLMLRYMREIYRHTVINYDHIFATIIRYQKLKPFTERAYRNRIFLAANAIMKLGTYRVHTILKGNYHDIIFEDPSEKFHNFMQLCLNEGIIRREGRQYIKNPDVKQGGGEFHTVRTEELTYVIANEIEPLSDVTEIIKTVARSPRKTLSAEIRDIFFTRDQYIFDRDYEKYFVHGDTKSPDIGRPFLQVPERIRGGIVLVHGYLAAPREVLNMANYFYREGYAVYGVRLKGHGTSPRDLATTKWEEWYESLNRGYTVIKSLTDRIILGGFSTGGGLALLAASRKGLKVESVFSINAPLRLRNYGVHLLPTLNVVNSIITRGRKKKSGQWTFVENSPENEHINYMTNPMTSVRQLSECIRQMEAGLPDIVVPTFIMQGSQDPVVDPISGQLIFARVGTPLKELCVLDRPVHGIINGPGSEDVFSRVNHFLDWAHGKRVEQEKSMFARETADFTPQSESSKK